jgi:hypothetical protein
VQGSPALDVDRVDERAVIEQVSAGFLVSAAGGDKNREKKVIKL